MKYVLFLTLAVAMYAFPCDSDSEYNKADFGIISGLVAAAIAAGSAAKGSHDQNKAARRAQENRLAQFKAQKEERESDLEAQKRQRDLDKEADMAKAQQPLLKKFQEGEQHMSMLGIEDTGRGNLANRILGRGARTV